MEIYKATNLINGKIYIGQTTLDTETRMDGHFREMRSSKKKNTYFHNALRKYGTSNFKFECIDKATSIDELNDKEVYWIKFYDSTNRNKGYNLDSGGSNCIKSESTKQKIGEQTRQDWENPDLASKMMGGLIKATEKWVQICEENRETIICKHCGKEVELPPHRARVQMYCSSSCSASHDNKGFRVATENKQAKLKIRNEKIRILANEWYKSSMVENEKLSDKYSPLFEIIRTEFNIKDHRSIIQAITESGRSYKTLESYFLRGN